MNYREKMREYLKEPNEYSSQWGKWGILNKEQRQMITRLLDEMVRADNYIKGLFLKNENLQSKIDKAIEFVEKENKICYTNKTTDDPQKVIGNFMWHTDKLLDILKEDK